MEKLNEKVYDIYDDYVHSKIDRRQFMEKLKTYVIGSLTVPAILAYLMPNYATAQVPVDDGRLRSKSCGSRIYFVRTLCFNTFGWLS